MKEVPFTVELDETAEAGAPEGPGPDEPWREGGGEPPVLSVSQLTRRIRSLLEEAFTVVAVEGELSNVKRAASGHLYFSLKDEDAQIRCVMFRSAASALRFEPEDGLQVIVRGRISVYEARGEYQVQVLTLEPKGAGALQVAFEQLKRKLEAEGLFDPAHKVPLPFLPRRVGLVTSPRGAAVRDMLHVLERRFPGMPVLLYPSVVQGDQAPAEIAEGLATLDRIAAREKIDVVIVGRGGGSVEDLWAFNTEVVARAIYACEVPVISAVGHEVDFTIADFVADVRAPTPSAAAEVAVPLRADLLATVEGLRARLFQRSDRERDLFAERWSALRARLGSPQGLIQQAQQRVDDLWDRVGQAGRFCFQRAQERYDQGREKLLLLRPERLTRLQRPVVRDLERRLGPAAQRHLERLRGKVTGAMELLESLSPLTVMGRGYGVVRRPTGALVRSAAEVGAGERLDVRLRDGSLETQVNEVRLEPAGPAGAPPDPPPGRTPGPGKARGSGRRPRKRK